MTTDGSKSPRFRRVAVLVGGCVLVVAVLLVFFLPRVPLYLAKREAERELKDDYEFYDAIPLPSIRKLPVTDYTNVLWVEVEGFRFGFPAGQFTLDPKSNRQMAKLNHDRYRLLCFPGFGAETLTEFMQPLGETNLYPFFRKVLHATRRQVWEQKSLAELARHRDLLVAKGCIVPGDLAAYCVEFDRGDLMGFAFGDPSHSKHLYLRIYLPRQEQFVDLGLITKVPLQTNEIESLISSVKLETK